MCHISFSAAGVDQKITNDEVVFQRTAVFFMERTGKFSFCMAEGKLCTTIQKAHKKVDTCQRILKKKINPDLEYGEVVYCCVHGGKTFKPHGQGLRPCQRFVFLYF
jgi:hypothetical protein